MSEQPRCPACGSVSLSPMGEVSASGGYSPKLELPLRERRLIGGSHVSVYLLGRLCGDCGHVTFWARPTELHEVRHRWAEIGWPEQT